MSKWRKRQVVVDAVQIPRSVDSEFGLLPLIELITKSSDERKVELKLHSGGLVEVIVASLEGQLTGQYPSWLVVGTANEPYIVEGGIFPTIYEPWDAESKESTGLGVNLTVWVEEAALQLFLEAEAVRHGGKAVQGPEGVVEYLRTLTNPDPPSPEITVRQYELADGMPGYQFTLQFPPEAE